MSRSVGYGKDLAFILRAMRRHSGVKQGTRRTDLVFEKTKSTASWVKNRYGRKKRQEWMCIGYLQETHDASLD